MDVLVIALDMEPVRTVNACSSHDSSKPFWWQAHVIVILTGLDKTAVLHQLMDAQKTAATEGHAHKIILVYAIKVGLVLFATHPWSMTAAT